MLYIGCVLSLVRLALFIYCTENNIYLRDLRNNILNYVINNTFVVLNPFPTLI